MICRIACLYVYKFDYQGAKDIFRRQLNTRIELKDFLMAQLKPSQRPDQDPDYKNNLLFLKDHVLPKLLFNDQVIPRLELTHTDWDFLLKDCKRDNFSITWCNIINRIPEASGRLKAFALLSERCHQVGLTLEVNTLQSQIKTTTIVRNYCFEPTPVYKWD